MAKSNDRPLSPFARAVQQAIGGEQQLGSDSDPAREAYPQLWEWLATVDCPGGRIKTPATVTLRLGPSGVLVTLTDRDLGLSVDASCAHLDNALAQLESMLGRSDAAVRSWGRNGPNLRKRRGG